MEPLVAEIERRYAELEAELGDAAVLADQRRYAEVAREHKRLTGAAELARRWR
jgi:protein subunit release factor A